MSGTQIKQAQPGGQNNEKKQTNGTWRDVDLSSNAIGAGGAHIFAALEYNQTLRRLVLTDNALGVDGLAGLSALLPDLPLVHLGLAGNCLGDREAEELAAGLKGNTALHSLDLGNNAIGDIGAIALGAALAGHPALESLSLAGNCIRARGLAGFIAGLRDNSVLGELNLAGLGIGDAAQPLGTWLARCGLQSLNVSRTRLTDVGMAALAKGVEAGYKLRDLVCSHNPFSDGGAVPLFRAAAACSTLRRLEVRGVRLSRDGRARMAEMRAERDNIVVVE